MGILLNRLLTVLNDADPKSTTYHITITLLMNFYELCDMTISQVAGLCTVSKSTISKFIRGIDFEDYADFRAAAPFEENKFGFNLNYNQNIMEYMENNDVRDYMTIIQNDIEECKNSIDMKQIDVLVMELIKYKKVAAFGLLFSEIAALDLQTKLAYNGKFIITNMNDVKQDEFIRNAGEDTLIIFFSNSGTYIKTYGLSEMQKQKNFSDVKAKLVLITSNEEMKNDPNIDLCICFKHTTSVQTHAVLYQIISDLITLRYRQLTRCTDKEEL